MIPQRLTQLHQWVCWNYETREGKTTKVPYQPSGEKAESDNRSTWSDFDTVQAAAHNFSGIGIMCADGLAGLDLDHCIENGEFTEQAQDFIGRMNTYTEVTPSGEGARCLFFGELPEKGRKKGNVEVYNSGRFFTVTGNHVEGTPETIENREAEIAEIHAEIFGLSKKKTETKTQGPPQPGKTTITDDVLIRMMDEGINDAVLTRLWKGDIRDYSSQSEADLAFCSKLAGWSAGRERIDRLYRASKLLRPKWDIVHSGDGLTYGQMTLDKAMSRNDVKWGDTSEQPSEPAEPSSGPPEIPCQPQRGLWIDRYVDYSRYWACNSYDGYHLASGLWVLSTVAARRVVAHMGFTVNTSLYIILCGETSVYKKSTVATLAIDFLRHCGLDHLLVQDVVTPQKLIQDMAGYLNLEKLQEESPEYQEKAINNFAFAGQRGWYYDEFDDALQSLTQRDGTMAPYKALFRSLYNCPETYKYGTKSTGTDVISKPYLSLLGSATPQAVKPFLRDGGEMWGNGFLARMTFVTPNGTQPKNQMPPNGNPQPPAELMAKIADWNQRLGKPDIERYTVTDNNDKPHEKIKRGPMPQNEIAIPDDVKHAWHIYDTYLSNRAWQTKRQMDFGNTRMSDWALRVSLLLASVEKMPAVTMPIWARAYELSLLMTEYQGNLLEKLVEINETSKGRELEEKIIGQIKKHGAMTMRELRQHIYGTSVNELTHTVSDMRTAGIVEEEKAGKTAKYNLA